MSRFHLPLPLLLVLSACTGEKVPATDDTGTDSKPDSEPGDSQDSDSPTESEPGDSKESNPPDSDSPTDSNDSQDTSPPDSGDSGVVVNNMLANPGFEEGNDGSWLVYPQNLANFAYETTGNGLYNSADTFTAYAGTTSLKVYGQYSGYPNETPIYQEFSAVSGEVYTFSGSVWMHHDDPLTATHTYAVLSLKYFDDAYNFYGTSDSVAFTNNNSPDTWTQLTVTGTIPAGATKVQAAIEYWQCVGDASGACYDGNGGLYFDEMVLTKDSDGPVDTGDTGVIDTGDSSVVDSGDSSVVDSGDSSVVDSGDSGVVDSGDSSVVDSGDSTLVDSGDSGASSAVDPALPLYFSGSSFSNTTPASASVTIPVAPSNTAGVLPSDPALLVVMEASGLNGTYNGGSTAFSIGVDAGTDYGQAVHAQVDLDFDGDGTVDRTELYNLFATDAAAGWESYTESAGFVSQSGSYADFVNGSVKVTLWKAFQPDPAFALVYDEAQSSITLPYGSGTPSISLANGDFENGADGSWLIYPSYLGNYAYELTGNGIYNSADTFTAYEGITALKIYGQWTGSQNETPIYQEFSASPGDAFTFSGYAWMHHDDALVATHTYAYLSLKYFDNSYNYYGSSDSAIFDASQPVDTWVFLSASGTVPAGATKVQAAIEYWQCAGQPSGNCWDGVGSVYFDDLVLQ